MGLVPAPELCRRGRFLAVRAAVRSRGRSTPVVVDAGGRSGHAGDVHRGEYSHDGGEELATTTRLLRRHPAGFPTRATSAAVHRELIRENGARWRVVVAGLGDSGILTAIRLARHVDVVGISTKPALVSGQELGARIARPGEWERDYWVTFDRFRGLNGARTVHGEILAADLSGRSIEVRCADGSARRKNFDALVISTGVTNGFWRHARMESAGEIAA